MSNQDLRDYKPNLRDSSQEKLMPTQVLLKNTWRIYLSKSRTSLGIFLPLFIFLILTGPLLTLLERFIDVFFLLIYILFPWYGVLLHIHDKMGIYLSCLIWTDSFWFYSVIALRNLIFYFLYLWAVVAFLYSLKENLGIIEAYKKGWNILAHYIRVVLLTIAMITGGFLFFFIPGIVFIIWFFCSGFILLFEGEKGFGALFRSRYLVKGMEWKLLARFLALSITLMIIIVVYGYFVLVLRTWMNIGDLMGSVLYYFLHWILTSFSLTYTFLIYKELSIVKGYTSYTYPSMFGELVYALPGIIGGFIWALMMGMFLLGLFTPGVIC